MAAARDDSADRRPIGGQIVRDSIVEQVADALREQIIGGDLGPGDRLKDSEIVEGFGVSRNTLREAYRLLMHEKLLVQKFNRGIFVRRPTRHDVRDVFALRRLYEVEAVRRMPGADPRAVGAVAGAVNDGRECAGRGDWPGVGTANMRFHRGLAALLGIDRVDEQMGKVLAELRLVFHAMKDPREFYEPYLPRNAEILHTAAEDNNPEGAAKMLTVYLDDAERQLLDAYSEPS